jgi:hypothetical protein
MLTYVEFRSAAFPPYIGEEEESFEVAVIRRQPAVAFT